ncbi:hypothetical protein AB0C51_11330 [Streptomyces pathocidini]|uniref:hypothetical protein n=1 Tax=Streptomyces pathocidini TaxID=1650571 RepID=UPI0033F54EE5
MTSSADTDQHPDVAEISALTEGQLRPDLATEVRDHLTDCELCAEVRESLDEIRSLLGSLPGPARMPADIAGRIDAALAAEALLDSTAPPAVSRETESQTGRGSSASSPGAPVSRETAPPVRETASPSRPHGHPKAATGPGRPGARRRWRTAVFGAACAVAVAALVGVAVQAFNPAGSDRTSTAQDADVKADSGSSTTDLSARVDRLLAASPKAEKAPSGGVTAESNRNRTMRGSAVTVPTCVRAGIGRTDAPLAAERMPYRGADAYLVVLSHVTDAQRVDVFVVDSSCTTKTPQGPGEVLLRDVYKRG